MKTTGIIKRIDGWGKIAIPKEIKRLMKIHENDAFEIYIDEDREMICYKKVSIQSDAATELRQIVEKYKDDLSISDKIAIRKIIEKKY